jgi:cysteinyl-tRNA synthetase
MPEIAPKATDHIKEQIELIQELEKKGYTYQTSDGIYFNTAKFPRYKDFGRLPDEKQGQARVEENLEKKNRADFALWKFSPKREKRQMEWRSPWGVGFPGWHIECSAMAMKYLGNHFDIHTGGVDHIRVHHTNEIAQSEAATEEPFANYWVHSEFLLVEGRKMSKSLGNIVTLANLVKKGFSPADFRTLLLMTHYRTQMNFTWEALIAAKTALSGLTSRLEESEVDEKAEIDTEAVEEFLSLLNDDINTPQAFAYLINFVKDKSKNGGKVATAAIMGEFLGLDLISLIKEKQGKLTEEIPRAVKELKDQREKAREGKNWKESDALREKIKAMGYEVKDTEDGMQIIKK